MEKNFIIPLVIYPFDVMVSIGEPDEILEKRLRRFGVKDDKELWQLGPNTLGRAARFSCNRSLIRLRKKPDSCVEYGILQHEIFHFVHFFMEMIGMPLSHDSGEAYAYLTGFITKEIYKKL